MTLREAISNVRTDLKKVSADTILTNKQIATILLKHSEWMVEQLSNTYKLGRRDIVYQTYNCAEVIDTPTIDPCCGITTSCTIKRTKEKLPAIYEDSYGTLIKEVSSIDGSTSIDNTNFSEFKSKKESPWGPKTKKYWFYKDGYIYGDLPKKIKITALFKENIDDKNKCDSSTVKKECTSFLDKPWTVPGLIQARVIDATVKELYPELNIRNQEMIDKNENQI